MKPQFYRHRHSIYEFNNELLDDTLKRIHRDSLRKTIKTGAIVVLSTVIIIAIFFYKF